MGGDGLSASSPWADCVDAVDGMPIYFRSSVAETTTVPVQPRRSGRGDRVNALQCRVRSGARDGRPVRARRAGAADQQEWLVVPGLGAVFRLRAARHNGAMVARADAGFPLSYPCVGPPPPLRKYSTWDIPNIPPAQKQPLILLGGRRVAVASKILFRKYSKYSCPQKILVRGIFEYYV